MVETCSRKFYSEPAETASIVFLVLFKNGGSRMSPRFHIFISDVNQENEQTR